MLRIHKDTENLTKVDSSCLPPASLLLESLGLPVFGPGLKHVTWMPNLQGRMASIHWSNTTGVELSSRVLLYGGERVEVKQTSTVYPGRRGTAYGPAKNGKQSIVQLQPFEGEDGTSLPVGIVVSASDFLVIDEAAQVSAAEEAAAALLLWASRSCRASARRS